jgi:hypothetical protein
MIALSRMILYVQEADMEIAPLTSIKEGLNSFCF